MTRIRHAGHGILALTLLLFGADVALSSGQRVLTDDGREVLLREDGTWEFVSNDRFANTDDGQRVRLKQDGTWEYAGHAPMASPTRVRTTELEIRLQRAVIEVQEEKVQKNKRVKSQTVFQLSLQASPLARDVINITEQDAALIRITDNNDRVYPVVSIRPAPFELKPQAQMTVMIRADGSPQWWKNVKYMKIELGPGLFGLREPVTLRQDVGDIEKKKVDGFEA